MPHGTPRQPWPRSVQFAGMMILGVVLAALRIGVAGDVVIFVITASLALGRP